MYPDTFPTSAPQAGRRLSRELDKSEPSRSALESCAKSIRGFHEYCGLSRGPSPYRRPGDAPSHLFDFIFNRAGDSAVTDVGIDLDQKIPADDHRLGFRMIDVRRNNRAPSRNLVADELWSDVFLNGGAEGFARMLAADVR